MIRIANPAEIGQALANIRDMLGISRGDLAQQIAAKKGRHVRSIENQLMEWDRGANAPNAKSLGCVLEALGYDLALVPREDA